MTQNFNTKTMWKEVMHTNALEICRRTHCSQVFFCAVEFNFFSRNCRLNWSTAKFFVRTGLLVALASHSKAVFMFTKNAKVYQNKQVLNSFSASEL